MTAQTSEAKKSSLKLNFPGHQGESLAARLDLPAGEPRAFALFAHCFTCSKDIFASARVANELAKRGIAVLRFDFTGLGASEGEFANTNFSSNVDDLLKAADYLRENYRAPEILIGHSLGGAAVLAAGPDIPEAKAIATIGAPSNAEHVAHNFGAKIDEIEANGVGEVTLGGRQFTIKKQFLEDIQRQSLSDRVARLNKALLIFHAPLDATVGIENAAEIYAAAKHPKSFISLDDADHLLSRRVDAEYVASVLSSWAARYLEPVEQEASGQTAKGPVAEGNVLVTESGEGKFQQHVVSGRHRLFADEPASYGGDDTGPSPYDFLNIALGACTSMTMRMYAERKGYDVDKISVEVAHDKVHAKDCEDCGEGREGRVDRFERTLEISGNLDAEAREKLVAIADKCPVHRTLEQSSAIVTRVKDA